MASHVGCCRQGPIQNRHALLACAMSFRNAAMRRGQE